ncbi:uncharacterized protein FOMMEDRAFT_138986 [Fomitiporia mediterranea MF3/22]|uniref:uncharacterized protein n=1 Tax=Fomitiporia mediterranea (strain MF3/22) TaxID=694068 RepID=UPI0004408A92|nr:uncharacterized protein FOMMEDRAFT_138986 [Fomitiporia mediterranea MF3/22]EJD05574.1 hypothetical protein FOMMEDRAFT_138986 [Fomitiporia mediterranea MF3/22]
MDCRSLPPAFRSALWNVGAQKSDAKTTSDISGSVRHERLFQLSSTHGLNSVPYLYDMHAFLFLSPFLNKEVRGENYMRS